MIKAAIVGASGYGGAELIRLLKAHPEVELSGLASRAHANKPAGEVWPQLEGELRFSDVEDAVADAEVVFLATPNGVAMELAPDLLASGKRVIDLSADFRLDQKTFEAWYRMPHQAPELLKEARYGLVELHRKELKGARLVANPGCYVTAASLALAPFFAEGLVEEAVVNAASGVSGAGREAAGSAFAEVNEDYKAYKPAGSHRHTPEIEQNLGRARAQGRWLETWGPEEAAKVTFVPHLVPMTRGILVTAYLRPQKGLSTEAALSLLKEFYSGEPFVRVSQALPRTKGTYAANTVWISARADGRTGWLVVFAALDNLIKGASGQAVQNLNAVYGLDETLGLSREGIWP